MVIRAVTRLALGLLASFAAVTATASVLWWSFDSGPLTSDPAIVLEHLVEQPTDFSADHSATHSTSHSAEHPPASAVRVYGDYQDLDPRSSARLTVDALQAAGGFDREVLMVTIPTGSGWVDPDQVIATEAWAGGDIATVAMRYSSAPSGVVYVLRPEVAARSAHALLTEVTDSLRTLPQDTRPQLIVHGLSLGAQAGADALADPAIAELVDSALWQGRPGARAASGNGGVESNDGQPANPSSDSINKLRQNCTVSAVNPDDPVAELSWDLLRDPGRALSVLTSLPGSDSAAPGEGHRYRPVLPPAGCVFPGSDTLPDSTTSSRVER